MVAPDKVLSMGQIERTICANKWLMLTFDCYNAILEMILLCAKRISLGSFKNVIYKMCLQVIYIWYMCIKRIGIKYATMVYLP